MGGQYTSNIGTLCPKQRTVFRQFLPKGNQQFSLLHISTFPHVTPGSWHVQPLSTRLSATQQSRGVIQATSTLVSQGGERVSHYFPRPTFLRQSEGIQALQYIHASPTPKPEVTVKYTFLYPQVIPNIWPISITFRPEFLRMRRRPIHMSVSSI